METQKDRRKTQRLFAYGLMAVTGNLPGMAIVYAVDRIVTKQDEIEDRIQSSCELSASNGSTSPTGMVSIPVIPLSSPSSKTTPGSGHASSSI